MARGTRVARLHCLRALLRERARSRAVAIANNEVDYEHAMLEYNVGKPSTNCVANVPPVLDKAIRSGLRCIDTEKTPDACASSFDNAPGGFPMQSVRSEDSLLHFLRVAPGSGTFAKAPTASLVAELHRQRDEHPIWRSRFLRLIAAGALSMSDLRHVFGQYYHYSRNFTRYIAALMARCPDDYFRARLSENLWDEGGGAKPELRHAQLYRNFLSRGLGLDDPEDIPCESFTDKFVHDYLDYCMTAEPLACAAFLSLGTESIVSRMYGSFVQGLEKAGIDETALQFFHVHIAVDDDHALTLEKLMTSYANEPHWYEACVHA